MWVERPGFKENMVQALQNGVMGSNSLRLYLELHPDQYNKADRDMQKMLAGGAAGAYYELTRPLDGNITDDLKEEVSEIVRKAQEVIIPYKKTIPKDFQPWLAVV